MFGITVEGKCVICGSDMETPLGCSTAYYHIDDSEDVYVKIKCDNCDSKLYIRHHGDRIIEARRVSGDEKEKLYCITCW